MGTRPPCHGRRHLNWERNDEAAVTMFTQCKTLALSGQEGRPEEVDLLLPANSPTWILESDS